MFEAQTTIEIVEEDPLLSGRELLPIQATFFPLGFPLELATNSIDVMEAARKSWRFFSQSFYVQPIHIEIGVEGKREDPLPDPPAFRSRGPLMSIISDAWNFSHCDFLTGFAYGWVTRRVAAESGFFRYNFLEPAALTLLDQRYLAPIHAALVVRKGRGVMLCGESFAGKSTLAYACAREGWKFIADDAVYLVRSNPNRFGIGNPYSIRFREGARALFKELNGWRVITRPNGKVGFEICTQELAIETMLGTKIDHVVFLDRHEVGPASLTSYPKSDAIRFWKKFANHGDENTKAEQMKSYERLLGARVWGLKYSNLNAAVLRLSRLVDSEG